MIPPHPGPDPRDLRASFDRFYHAKWENHDGFWLDWYPPHLALYADLLRQRNREIEAVLPPGLHTALDCGCGAGDVSALLSRHVGRVVSLDVSVSNLTHTRANLTRLGAGPLVIRAGAEELPFSDGTFDAAVLADVIEHVPDRVRTVAELARVLRPGGLAIIVTPDRAVHEAIERIDAVATTAIRGARRVVRTLLRRAPLQAQPSQPGEWEEFLGREELRELFVAGGFRVREHRNVAFYPGPEGGGAFAMLLGTLAGHDRLRQKIVEPALRRAFAAIGSIGFFNQKQMLVGERI
jgi:ubiquinone/menaquinone biosynthesis C-methylase UbiE